MMRPRLILVLALASTAIGLALVEGTRAEAPTAASVHTRVQSNTAGRPCGVTRKYPRRYRHVVWIIFENKTYDDIIGNAAAPYINSVASACGLATSFTAEGHPSLPNYIAMTSGSTQGISDDSGPDAHQLAVPSIFSQLGGRWRALEDAMPSNCDHSDSGFYAVRHNPAVYYTNIASQCAARDVPLGSVPDLSAPFTFITPSTCHDMHSSSCGSDSASETKNGDTWLASFLPKVLASPAYRSRQTVIFVTWDEDDFHHDQHIATIVIAPSVRRGTRASAAFTHYSMLRTTEDLLGLPHLGGAATAPGMRAAFRF
jgi:phosphatidylinositol-3-phosphatase